STLKGDLFLIGFSINDETDKHIIESIQESVIERVYVGYYKELDKDFEKRIKQLSYTNDPSRERELFIFNTNEAIQWKAIKLVTKGK
ncbi:TPA: hypothetical protein VAH50_003118, partial [Legionella pneumophila]|nr:hypothetical protein [Legionella pneumophila]HEO1338822.1 hypothetical protein [Legionella pneumophila]